MRSRYIQRPLLKIVIAVILFSVLQLFGFSQSNHKSRDLQPKFDLLKMERSCGTKGRLQDRVYCHSKIVRQVLSSGKNSIPVLIDLLSDERKTPEPVMDFWPETSVGDIAFIFLTDFFEDSKWQKNFAPGLGWDEVDKECDPKVNPGYVCWFEFIHNHGRGYMQGKWKEFWNKNKTKIYWNDKERCFMVKP
jgi:hypothetical protein